MYTFNHKYVIGALLLALSAVTLGCIDNDIPYPKIQPNFTSFEVEGQTRATAIDSVTRTVTVYLNEEVDIQHLRVIRWGITEGAEFPDSAMVDGYINLTDTVKVTMSIYQDYVWNITAIQPIDRYFTIGSQVGSSVIDVESHTVKALVPMQQPLETIEVNTMKLAGTTATYSPELAGRIVDFTQPVTVTVSEFGRDTEWTVTVEQTEVSVDLERVDAWTCVAWLYGVAEDGKSNGFQYRPAGTQEWIDVPQEWITHSGGSFVARLIGLSPETEYVARATSDDENSVDRHFTTGSVVQLPNSQFTGWNLEGKVWNPWASGEEAFWGTGNRGATTLGDSNTTPIADAMSSTGYDGAQLMSKFVGLSVVGKLAAGNLFAGVYVKTVGTNGILDFGRPFTQRPTSLSVKIKYNGVPISHFSKSNPDHSAMKGQPDTCIVWCALGDWDEPYEIRTSPSDRQLFDRNNAGVIAYGEYQTAGPVYDYTEITIPLEYNSTSRVPKYILVTASASKYGDYFTGGNGSVMCVRDIVLHYDY